MIARSYGPSAETGQTIPEYSVIMAVILLAVVATLGLLTGEIQTVLQSTMTIL